MSAATAPVPTRRRPGGSDLLPDALEPDPRYRAGLEWIWSFSAARRTPAEVARQRELRPERMRALLRRLGDPHAAFPSLLVGGTKGKGSVVAMLASCLAAAGYRTGAYTSPHLVNWRERTCVDGRPIATAEVRELLEPVRRAVEALPPAFGRPSTFEVGTLIAFLHFARVGVDIAAVEVGVGGRDDATNVLDPLVSAVTPISYDHTETLGSTLTSIARAKAGIMRRDRATVLAPQPDEAATVLDHEARATGARLMWADSDWRWHREVRGQPPVMAQRVRIIRARSGEEVVAASLPLLGVHQCANAVVAVAALEALGEAWPAGPLARRAIRAGLERVQWPARLQVVRMRPLVVLDGAHNAASAQALRRAVREHFAYRQLHLVIGLTMGKDASGVLQALLPLAASATLTRSAHERAADPSGLSVLVGDLRPELPVQVRPHLPGALEAALERAGAADLVLVAGSLFLVGEALVWARNP